MKTLDDHTLPELAALDEAAIDALIDLECAIAGVPMLPPTPTPPEPLAAVYDVTLYEIGGFRFRSREDAEHVAAAINGRLVASMGYDYKVSGSYVSDYEPVETVVQVRHDRTQACHDAQRSAKLAHKALTDAYKAQQSEYDTIAEQRETVAERVRAAASSARSHAMQADRLREEFARYLELAQQDRRIALNFLRAARADALALHSNLLREFDPDGYGDAIVTSTGLDLAAASAF